MTSGSTSLSRRRDLSFDLSVQVAWVAVAYRSRSSHLCLVVGSLCDPVRWMAFAL